MVAGGVGTNVGLIAPQLFRKLFVKCLEEPEAVGGSLKWRLISILLGVIRLKLVID